MSEHNDVVERVRKIEGTSLVLGTNSLRKELFAILQGIRSGHIGTSQASAAARIGEVVVASLHVELLVVKELGLNHTGLPTLGLATFKSSRNDIDGECEEVKNSDG